MAEYRIAVLASGEGTNLQALIDQVHTAGRGRIVLVASDKVGSGAVKRAVNAGIPALTLPPCPGEGRTAFHRRLAVQIRDVQPDLVVLAGYMRLLPGEFIAQLAPIINVHPSLLPAFPGLDAPAQAIAGGVKTSGCSVHLVDEGMDTGPIILQRPVPVLPGDSAESLHNRIKEAEHQALVDVCLAFAQGRVDRQGEINLTEEIANED